LLRSLYHCQRGIRRKFSTSSFPWGIQRCQVALATLRRRRFVVASVLVAATSSGCQ
jgi:hypothetical protein